MTNRFTVFGAVDVIISLVNYYHYYHQPHHNMIHLFSYHIMCRQYMDLITQYYATWKKPSYAGVVCCWMVNVMLGKVHCHTAATKIS